MLQARKADVNDIDLIQQLAYTIWPETYNELLSQDQLQYMLQLIYSKDSLRNQVEQLKHQFIILTDNAIPIGFASYSPKDGSPKTYRLHKLYVLPAQHRKGAGSFLLNYIIDEIKSVAKILELNVKRDNPAVHFYKKLGFTIACDVDLDIGNGYFMRDYIMELLF